MYLTLLHAGKRRTAKMHLSITFARLKRMLSKAKIKLVQSLVHKKHRDTLGLFTVEGNKSVVELLRSKIRVNSLFATHEWLITQPDSTFANDMDVHEVTAAEMRQLSSLTSPGQVLAVAVIPENELVSHTAQGLILALDGIQDPGNLGTIIRVADWYGISHIVCSMHCADVYNPKTVQASMGSFLRVRTIRCSLSEYLAGCGLPVYGAVLNGESAYGLHMPQNAVLVIGNEGSGISPDISPYIQFPVSIPRRGEAESLNASVATAILCDTWARNLTTPNNS
jgi:TrmH family RNA methyltransferase